MTQDAVGMETQSVLAVNCHVTPSYLIITHHDFLYTNPFYSSLDDNGLLNIYVLLTCYSVSYSE